MITLETLKKNVEVQTLLKAEEKQMQVLGYTEHSLRHITLTAKRAREILTKLGCPQREVELGEMAAYLHDIGNAVNRFESVFDVFLAVTAHHALDFVNYF